MTTAAGPPAQQCPLQSFPHFCGEVSAKNSFADLCSLADTYLAYSYLCRSGEGKQNPDLSAVCLVATILTRLMLTRVVASGHAGS